MAAKTLEDGLYEELRDLSSAEKQITKALPKMAKKATYEPLKRAFEEHLEQTRKHVERIEQAMETMGKAARSKRCEGMEGLLEEGKEIMEHDLPPEVMDAMLIASAQKVEHYEIAAYGTLCTWAEQIGEHEVLKLLKETLDEEKKTDEKLTELSRQVNPSAVAA